MFWRLRVKVLQTHGILCCSLFFVFKENSWRLPQGTNLMSTFKTWRLYLMLNLMTSFWRPSLFCTFPLLILMQLSSYIYNVVIFDYRFLKNSVIIYSHLKCLYQITCISFYLWKLCWLFNGGQFIWMSVS